MFLCFDNFWNFLFLDIDQNVSRKMCNKRLKSLLSRAKVFGFTINWLAKFLQLLWDSHLRRRRLQSRRGVTRSVSLKLVFSWLLNTFINDEHCDDTFTTARTTLLLFAATLRTILFRIKKLCLLLYRFKSVKENPTWKVLSFLTVGFCLF